MKLNLKILAVFSLIFYLILTFIIPSGVLDGFDYWATVFLQKVFPSFVAFPFSFFSLIGSFEIASIFILILWWFYKKLNYFYVLIYFSAFHILELIGKRFFEHPGPPSELARYIFSFSFPSSGVKPGSSYPSGHMGRTVFISVLLLAIIFRNKNISKKNKYIFTLCILIFNLLMFISRIYLGEHWFSDLFGGVILGTSMALFAILF
jgi:undecaprenyl-diphosphatase